MRPNLPCLFQKGEKLSRSEVKTMIDEVDENRDGRLDYKEVRCDLLKVLY